MDKTFLKYGDMVLLYSENMYKENAKGELFMASQG
jgi:hypothetical protein